MNPTKLSITERNMILNKVASFLENNPDKYFFDTCDVPQSQESVGCMLGWLGYFMEEDYFTGVLTKLGFESGGNFYDLCTKVLEEIGVDPYGYHDSAHFAAICLREIAYQNFPINLPAREPERDYSLED